MAAIIAPPEISAAVSDDKGSVKISAETAKAAKNASPPRRGIGVECILRKSLGISMAPVTAESFIVTGDSRIDIANGKQNIRIMCVMTNKKTVHLFSERSFILFSNFSLQNLSFS